MWTNTLSTEYSLVPPTCIFASPLWRLVAMSQLFSRSMTYHRIVSGRELQQQRSARVEDVPSQVVLPSPGNPTNMTLPLGAVAEADDPNANNEPIVIYSSKPLICKLFDANMWLRITVGRMNVGYSSYDLIFVQIKDVICACWCSSWQCSLSSTLLWLLSFFKVSSVSRVRVCTLWMLLCCLQTWRCVLTILYLVFTASTYAFRGADTPFDTLTIVNTFASLFVLIVGITLLNPWLLLIFLTTYAFDAIINLFRMHSSAQLGFMMCQWMLIYVVDQYRQLVKPAWARIY